MIKLLCLIINKRSLAKAGLNKNISFNKNWLQLDRPEIERKNYHGKITLPRDLYHGKGALEALKTLKGKKAIVVVGGGSMKRFGFLDKVVSYLQEAGMEVQLFEGCRARPHQWILS